MLSAGSFSSPYEHLSQPETKRMVEHYTAYLSDNTRLIANPGLKVSAGRGPASGVPLHRLGRGCCQGTFEVGGPALGLHLSAREPERQCVAPRRLVGDDASDGLRSPVGQMKDLFQALDAPGVF